MRVVLDTNIFVSALLSSTGLTSKLIELWRLGYFDVLTSSDQLDEIRRVTRYPNIASRISSPVVGTLINTIKKVSIIPSILPCVRNVSPDPFDDYLLSIAVGGNANFLVTGDKDDLLSLGGYCGVKILSCRDFISLNKQFGYNI